MAQDNHKPKPATIHRAEKKTPESKSLRLKRLIIAGVAAALILSVGNDGVRF
jgi:hypothetical protein